jgi:hypothetical protein
MTPTEKRDLAMRLAPTDSDRALVIARGIEDSWFACQALASVARFCPENSFRQLVKESLRVGSSAVDPYKVVACAAWPVRAIVERKHLDMLDSVIPELLKRAEQIELFASRSEALFLIFQAIYPAGRERWFEVFQALRKACVTLISWRQRRNLRDAVLIIWNDDKATAKDVISQLEDAKLKNQIERKISSSELFMPRSFFRSNAA